MVLWFFGAGAASIAGASEWTGEIGATLRLDGRWDMGLDRAYSGQVDVPGLATAPIEASCGTVWFRRSVHLPTGDWNRAVLRLKGARFAPAVWVDGAHVSAAAGGMAPTEHELRGIGVVPGGVFELEVALRSLRDVESADASAVPAADRWRSNLSSGLWDSVELHLYRDARFVRVLPFYDAPHGRLSVRWQATLSRGASAVRRVRLELVRETDGTVLAASVAPATEGQGSVTLALPESCASWSPEHPNLHRLRMTLLEGDAPLDRREIAWGRRDFRVEGKQMRLNGDPVRLRGVSVVWHRWLRDPEAATLAWDAEWFDRQIVSRLRALGGNYLRFHLGLPPERLLDLCDRRGVLVQIEWPFFHGVPASRSSMEQQWRAWLDVAQRHPCVALVQPWNETEPDALKEARAALATILPEYPAMVVAYRDYLPVHKYWWSLFENLGLYYDSAEQFEQAVVVDEFGGNYLDGQGEPGAYPTIKESQRRFLGLQPTREQRLRFQAESCGRVAEYWRRVGVAGFAPFCALSSPADGNHWFLGPLRDGNPKPVWAALSAALAPVSASIDLWDRNFPGGARVSLPVRFFNDTALARQVTARVRLVSLGGQIREEMEVSRPVPAFGTERAAISLRFPAEAGDWRLEAVVPSLAREGGQEVVSQWQCRTLVVDRSEIPVGVKVAVPEDETELRAFLRQNDIEAVSLGDAAAGAVLISAKTWMQLPSSPALRAELDRVVARGRSVVMLEVGPRLLGPGYTAAGVEPIDRKATVANPREDRHALIGGVRATFRETAEPESHLHPAGADASLWSHLPLESTWLWNGLRGGLIVPAAEMEISGLSRSGSAELWRQRGADPDRLGGDRPLFAYELAGYYEFSESPDDEAAAGRLRRQVAFLADDAPSLRARIERSGGVHVVDLRSAERAIAPDARATGVTPLASCGVNLARQPVVEIAFGPHEGALLLSQVLTSGRLIRTKAGVLPEEEHYDPAAEQFALNLLARALRKFSGTATVPAPR